MRKVRVLHFADLVNRHDFIDNVVRNVDPRTFEMAVCTMGRPSNIEDPAYAGTDIQCWDLPAVTRSHYPATVLRLEALLRREKFDIVHAHHYEPCVIAAAATALRPRSQLVIGRHYSDAIYLHTSGWRRTAMLEMERSVNTRASLIIAPTQRIATLLVDRQGVPARKVVVIPYCFDPAKYVRVKTEAVEAKRRLLGMRDCFTIGTFGRLYPDKGHRYVLDALPAIASAVPSLKYLIVGEGEERSQLERQVTDLGLGKMVTFLGWRTDAPELMAAVDVVVQPSVQEALSQSMAEALFLGRPLVITDVSGANELVPDESIGVVVPCQDSAAIAGAVIALERDPQRRVAVANAGMRHALTSFTIDAVVPRYETAYRSASESTRSGLRRSAARRRRPR